MKSSIKTALYAFCCTLLCYPAGNGCKAASLPRYNALSIDMSKFKVIEHGEETDLMSAIMGNTSETITLWQAVRALEIAERDPKVKFLFLKTDGATIGTGEIQEFRKALNNFRKSGKPVISYMETPTTGSYYLASMADKVCITSHHGSNDIRGVRTSLIFLKDLLDKYGVNVQLIRHGKYKSAGEMFTRSEASPEDMEQNREMVKSMWNGYASEIAGSRSITTEALDSLIDNLSLNFSEDFVKNSLADTVVSLEGIRSQLCSLAGTKRFGDIKMVDFQNYAKVKTHKRSHKRNKIAVIYADGNIIDGDGTKKVAGDRFASMIAAIRADSTIKAVV
ncbi:MAG: S49 family peptidase, partial [Bacteroidales bacterium]|nr:S49 family peptidase [Bacteroidales bacterium]